MGKLLAEENMLYSILSCGYAGSDRTSWKKYAAEHHIRYADFGDEDVVLYLSDDPGMLFDVTDHNGYPSRIKVRKEYLMDWKEALKDYFPEYDLSTGMDVYELAAIAGILFDSEKETADEKMAELLNQTEEE